MKSSEGQLKLLVLLLLIGAVYVFYSFMYKPLKQQETELTSSVSNTDFEIRNKYQTILTYEKNAEAIKNSSDNIKKIDDLFFTEEDEQEEFLDIIDEKLERSGLLLGTIESLDYIPVDADLKDSFEQARQNIEEAISEEKPEDASAEPQDAAAGSWDADADAAAAEAKAEAEKALEETREKYEEALDSMLTNMPIDVKAYGDFDAVYSFMRQFSELGKHAVIVGYTLDLTPSPIYMKRASEAAVKEYDAAKKEWEKDAPAEEAEEENSAGKDEDESEVYAPYEFKTTINYMNIDAETSHFGKVEAKPLPDTFTMPQPFIDKSYENMNASGILGR